MPTKSLVSKKAQRFTESVIREMTRLNNVHGGVNLAQGFPDFPAPEEVKAAAADAIHRDVNQYSITWGAKRLREAIAAKTKRFYGVSPDPEKNICVTCGSTEAMISTLLATVDPGEEVIVFEPFYENYGPDAILSGATPRFVKLRPPDWTFDDRELAAAFNDRTKAIIINTPNNPTGKVYTREELTTIARLCQKWDALAVTDEIYEHIVYDGLQHVPMATLDGMADRTVWISGCSKTYSVTGWRVGYTIAPERLTNAIRKVHDFLTVGAPAPLQEGAAVAMGLPDAYYAGLVRDYTERRETIYGGLAEAGLAVSKKPGGAYYLLCDIARFGHADDTAFAHWLVKEIGVAGVPGSSFFNDPRDGQGLIRFTFCKRLETLKAACQRLRKLGLETRP